MGTEKQSKQGARAPLPLAGFADQQPSSLRPRLLIALSLLVFVTLGRVCTHEFVQWDDPQTIASNPAFNPPDFRAIATYWIHPAEALYVPLTYSVWGLLAYVAHVGTPDESGSMLNPWIYHTANLMIHLAATIVVFLILRRLTKHDIAALVGAAVFAVHPVQVETVAWASGTKDLLCGLFIAASVYCWLLNRRKSGDAACYAFALLACLSKPTAIVIPFILLVVDWMVRERRTFVRLWPVFGISIIVAIIAKCVQ